jgi:hypothetical protein
MPRNLTEVMNLVARELDGSTGKEASERKGLAVYSLAQL